MQNQAWPRWVNWQQNLITLKTHSKSHTNTNASSPTSASIRVLRHSHLLRHIQIAHHSLFLLCKCDLYWMYLVCLRKTCGRPYVKYADSHHTHYVYSCKQKNPIKFTYELKWSECLMFQSLMFSSIDANCSTVLQTFSTVILFCLHNIS